MWYVLVLLCSTLCPFKFLFSSWCHVAIVIFVPSAVQRVGLQCLVVAFSGRTHLHFYHDCNPVKM